MNRYKITFSDLRNISDAIQKDRIDIFIHFLNSFQGSDIFLKFKSFLTAWGDDISPYLTFRDGQDKKNVPISFLLKECENLSGDMIIEDGDIIHKIGIPDVFYNNDDVIPIYTILKTTKYKSVDAELDWCNMEVNERKKIIDQLPPKMFNLIVNSLLKDTSKILKYTHPSLSNFTLNFYTNEPLNFLKSMFLAYDSFYFRDITYHLSSKLGSNLESSTIQDIEYYLKKMSQEMETESPVKI